MLRRAHDQAAQIRVDRQPVGLVEPLRVRNLRAEIAFDRRQKIARPGVERQPGARQRRIPGQVRGRMADPLGIDLVASAPDEFAAFLDRQMEIWGRVVRENDIRSD